MDHVKAGEIAAEILTDDDVGAIFARAFRWVLREREAFQEYEGDLSRLRARREGTYKEAFKDLRIEIGPVTVEGGSAGLRPGIRQSVGSTLESHLVESGEDEIFPVMLAFLDALDRTASTSLREAFFDAHVGGGCTIDPARAFPSHWGAFGTDVVPEDRFPPEYEVTRSYQRLAAYFQGLAVTPFDTAANTPAALHISSRMAETWEGEGHWKIAVVNVLANSEELRLENDRRRFWVPALVRGVAGPSRTIEERVEWALGVSRRRGASLIVLPELSADDQIVAQIREGLRLWPRTRDETLPLAILGKVHEPAPGGTRYRNAPTVISRSGVMDWAYWKINPFEATIGGAKLEEALDRTPPPYVLGLDTPLGRVAVVVCYDFLINSFRQTLLQMRPNVVVVTAMTGATSIQQFQEFAAGMSAGCRAVTVFCNSAAHYLPGLGAGNGRAAAQKLGFVRSNTRMHRNQRPRSHGHALGAAATVGVYTLTPAASGLDVAVRSTRLR